MIVCGLDPGAKYFGYAILDHQECVLASGTWIARDHHSSLGRRLLMLDKLYALIDRWQPALVAYEEFTWRTGNEESQYVVGRAAMERLLGYVETLAQRPPCPHLAPLLPGDWGRQLLGETRHTKEQMAWAVNQRLGQAKYAGSHNDNHECDAVGIAFVALDNWKIEQRAGRLAQGASVVTPMRDTKRVGRR